MSDDGGQLYRACYSSDPQKALQLLNSWDQQRIQDAAQYKSGFVDWTPLHGACGQGHVKVVEMLLKHGADADAKNNFGDTPLHRACDNDHVEVVEMLLKHGVDAKAKTKGGYTPLHIACYIGHVKVVEMLLKHGADAKVKANDGWRPLHKACFNGHDKVAEILLKHGAETEAKNSDGQTPLQLACAARHPSRKVVQQLLRHGADPDARDLTGARLLDLLLGRDRINLEVITELLGATQTLCSYQTSNSNVQGLIHAEQGRRWRCAAAVLCNVGWRVDPQLFNIHDLHTLCDYQAAQTATAQAASTN